MTDWIFVVVFSPRRRGSNVDEPFLVCLVIFGLPGHALFVCGVVCFGWVLGFSRLGNLLLIDARFFVGVFVESLILAQDERWRRA